MYFFCDIGRRVCVCNDLTRPEKGNFGFWQYPRRQTGRRRAGTDLAPARRPLLPSQSLTSPAYPSNPYDSACASRYCLFFSVLFKLLWCLTSTEATYSLLGTGRQTQSNCNYTAPWTRISWRADKGSRGRNLCLRKETQPILNVCETLFRTEMQRWNSNI